ncbi:MAG: MurT ligase domain-containing protein [Micrococcales bacterium]
MIYLPAIVFSRLARVVIRQFRPGGGSALPGLLLSKVAPKLLAKTLRGFPQGVVVITGSAGKSTTTKMVVAIARAHGLAVFTNPSTANIRQGFFSSIIEKSDLFGRIPGDIAILEMDEGHAESITGEVAPRIVTLLNVLEDQLDRFIEPAIVRDKLRAVASRATQCAILNADDQNILLIDEQLQLNEKSWFGISGEVLAGNNLGVAPTFTSVRPRPRVQAEVSSLNGKRCAVSIGEREAIFDLPNRGLHYALDAIAALSTAKELLGDKFDLVLAEKVLDELPPVFARGEVVHIGEVPVEFVLVQNPTSFQLNLDNLELPMERIMVAVGRDVHDPSWLWTVDLSRLNRVDVISGYNYAELGLRLAYENVQIDKVEPDLFKAFEHFMALPEPRSGIRTVIFSADAMRRLRRHLGFTSPDEVER